MPPFARSLVSDTALAIVYDYLDGVEAVETRAPITVTVEGSAPARADGLFTSEAEVEFRALAPDTNVNSDGPNSTPFGYRVTLLTRENGPVANRTLEYRLAERDNWSKLTTDERGQAFLRAHEGCLVAEAIQTDKEQATGRLRMRLPAGRYACVVEALECTAAANPVVLGIGTAIFSVD